MKLIKKIIFLTGIISFIQIIITPLILKSINLDSEDLYLKKIRSKATEICKLNTETELDKNIKRQTIYSIICELGL